MRWLLANTVSAIHMAQITRHGGSLGVRDSNLLESALARPQQHAAYANPTVFELAAAYCYGIVRNHPFVDGNKRTGFLAAYTFLRLNGWQLEASEPDAALTVIALADSSLDEAAFATWLKDNSKAVSRIKE